MSKNINQITTAATTVNATDKLYIGRSPFGLTDDRYILGSDVIAQFGSPLTTKGDLYTFSTVNARLGVGATNGMILQVNSAATSGLAWSSTTWPATTTVNRLLWSSATNVISDLATANNSVLVTSAGGVPSVSSTLPSGLTIPGFAKSGANADITSMTALTGTIKAPTFIDSSASVHVFGFNYTASAVNYIGVFNNTTGNGPYFQALGTDTNVRLTIQGQGTGGAAVQGTGTNDNAASGYVGELISSQILAASPVTINSSTNTNITALSLTAGDWDVWGNVNIAAGGGGNVLQNVLCWISSVSATIPDSALYNVINLVAAAGSINIGQSAPQMRFSLSATTTIYLSAFQASSAAGAGTATGGIYARRRR